MATTREVKVLKAHLALNLRDFDAAGAGAQASGKAAHDPAGAAAAASCGCVAAPPPAGQAPCCDTQAARFNISR